MIIIFHNKICYLFPFTNLRFWISLTFGYQPIDQRVTQSKTSLPLACCQVVAMQLPRSVYLSPTVSLHSSRAK